jgi:hypothetical protein
MILTPHGVSIRDCGFATNSRSVVFCFCPRCHPAVYGAREALAKTVQQQRDDLLKDLRAPERTRPVCPEIRSGHKLHAEIQKIMLGEGGGRRMPQARLQGASETTSEKGQAFKPPFRIVNSSGAYLRFD